LGARFLASNADRTVVRIDSSTARGLVRGAQVHRHILDDDRIIRRADPYAALASVFAAFAMHRARLDGGVHHGDCRLDNLGVELGLVDALGRFAPAGQILEDLILSPLGRWRVAGPGLDRGTDRHLARADQGPCNLVLSRHLSLLGAVPRRMGCRTSCYGPHHTDLGTDVNTENVTSVTKPDLRSPRTPLARRCSSTAAVDVRAAYRPRAASTG